MDITKKDWIYTASGEVVECATREEAFARFLDLYHWTDLTPTLDEVLNYAEYREWVQTSNSK